MDELVKTVAERTGLPEDKARQAAEAVIGFLEEKLPDPIADKLGDFIEGKGDDIGDAIGDAADKFKGLLGG